VDGVNVHSIQVRARDERSQATYLLRVLRFFLHSAYFIARKHLANPYQLIQVSVPDFLVFAAFLPRLLGTPVILDNRDVLPEFYCSKFKARTDSIVFKLLVLVEKCSAAFADHVIVANDLWYQRLTVRSVRREKCTSIRNYPDADLFFQRPRARGDGKFVVMYPGTLNFHQGLDVAIRAFAQIKDTIPEAEFHIYGEGPERARLIELVDILGLSGKVLFKPVMPYSQIAQVMADANVAVVPKRSSSCFGNEAASTKIFEFMAVGVPVIVSRTEIDSYYFDGSLVKFFESENEADLAESILLLYRNQGLRKQLASNAANYAQKNSWQSKKLQYLHLVDSLAMGKKHGQNPRRLE